MSVLALGDNGFKINTQILKNIVKSLVAYTIYLKLSRINSQVIFVKT